MVTLSSTPENESATRPAFSMPSTTATSDASFWCFPKGTNAHVVRMVPSPLDTQPFVVGHKYHITRGPLMFSMLVPSDATDRAAEYVRDLHAGVVEKPERVRLGTQCRDYMLSWVLVKGMESPVVWAMPKTAWQALTPECWAQDGPQVGCSRKPHGFAHRYTSVLQPSARIDDTRWRKWTEHLPSVHDRYNPDAAWTYLTRVLGVNPDTGEVCR